MRVLFLTFFFRLSHLNGCELGFVRPGLFSWVAGVPAQAMQLCVILEEVLLSCK